MQRICFINYIILRFYTAKHKIYSRAATPATARAPTATPARLPLLEPVGVGVAEGEVWEPEGEPEAPSVEEEASVAEASVLEVSVSVDSALEEVLVETGLGVVLRVVFSADLVEWVVWVV